MIGKTTALAIVTLIALGADEPAIEWARSWDDAFREAKQRNVPIFLAFLKDGCPGSTALLGTTFRDPMVVAYLNEVAVPLAAHTADVGMSHEPEEVVDPKTGAKSYRCPIYKTITCTDHNYIHSQALDLIEVKETPKCFVLGPDGKPVDGTGEVRGSKPKEIVEALRRTQKKIGRPLSRSTYRKAMEGIEAGLAAFDAGDWPSAISVLRGVSRNRKGPEGLRKRADEILAEVNDKGLDLLREAKVILEENPEEGLRRIRKLRSDFRGLPAADEAKRILAESRERK